MNQKHNVSNYRDHRQFIIRATAMTGANVKRSNYQLKVKYQNLAAAMRRIQLQGGKIVEVQAANRLSQHQTIITNQAAVSPPLQPQSAWEETIYKLVDYDLETLSQLLSDSNPIVQLAAVGALAKFGEPAWHILAQAALSDCVPLAVAAVGAIGTSGDADADGNSHRQAIEMLSQIANRDCLPEIKNAAQLALSHLQQINLFEQTS